MANFSQEGGSGGLDKDDAMMFYGAGLNEHICRRDAAAGHDAGGHAQSMRGAAGHGLGGCLLGFDSQGAAGSRQSNTLAAADASANSVKSGTYLSH